VPLAVAWPIWQGDEVGRMNCDRVDEGERRQWCGPTVSYHHLSPNAIRGLWEFEQKWVSDAAKVSTSFIPKVQSMPLHVTCAELTSTTQSTPNPFLRHKDVFANYILPQTPTPRSNWDNHSDKELASSSPSSSQEDCNMLCEKDSSCLQWAFSAEGKCLSTSKPGLGEPSNGTVSGWIPGRMQAFYDEGPVYGNVRWIS
jgi:hypothetical protein